MKKFLLTIVVCSMAFYVDAQTPVATNGRLMVKGVNLCNQNGFPIQLKGMSSFGLQWNKNCMSKSSVTALRNDWKSDVLRIAMYVEEGGYNTDTAQYTAKVDSIVHWCLDLGLYCIIDWHILTPGDPLDPKYKDALKFFGVMAKRFGNKPNVMFELCNEPNGDGVDWARIKLYATPLIKEIRKYSQNVIFVGSPSWDQNIWDPGNDPISGVNIMYTFHFYSLSHGNLLPALEYYSEKIPVFVTEWGPTDYTGNGSYDTTVANKWISLMQYKKIGWCAWTYSDNGGTTSVLNEGSCADEKWNNTTDEGSFIKSKIMNPKMEIPQAIGPIIMQAIIEKSVIHLMPSVSVRSTGLLNNRYFSAKSNGNNVPIDSVTILNSGEIRIKLSQSVTIRDSVVLSYNGKGSITDSVGNKLRAFSDKPLPNLSTVPGYYTKFDSIKDPFYGAVDYGIGFSLNNELIINGHGQKGWPTMGLYLPMLDLSKNPKLSVSVKTKVAANLRIDLVDWNGNVTGCQEIVEPLNNDLQYHNYTFNFKGKICKTVDSSHIAGLYFYINPGATFSDSVFINKLFVGDSLITVSSVKLSNKIVNLKMQDTQKLSLLLTPTNASKLFGWTSTNSNIATVSDSGVVTGIKQGTVKIIVHSALNTSVGDTCVVTVDNKGTIITSQLLQTITLADSVAKNAHVGTLTGMYTQTTVSTFQTAITQARVLATSNAKQFTIDSVNEKLNETIEKFLVERIDPDYSPLTTALLQASYQISNLSVGTLPGQYPQASMNKLASARDLAMIVASKPTTQAQIDSSAAALKTVMSEFSGTVVKQTANYAKLDSLLAVAQITLAQSKVGTTMGTYTAAQYKLFSAQIDSAMQTDYNFTSTQADIDKAVAKLTKQTSDFKQSKIVGTSITEDDAVKTACYPIPFSTSLNVSCQNTTMKRIVVNDLYGKTIVIIQPDAQVVTLETGSFPIGIYIVSIELADGTMVHYQTAKQ